MAAVCCAPRYSNLPDKRLHRRHATNTKPALLWVTLTHQGYRRMPRILCTLVCTLKDECRTVVAE